MAVLATIAGATIAVAQYTFIPALIYVAWKDIASPLTLFLASSALVGVMYDTFVIPDRTPNTIEKAGILGVGATLSGMSVYNRATSAFGVM